MGDSTSEPAPDNERRASLAAKWQAIRRDPTGRQDRSMSAPAPASSSPTDRPNYTRVDSHVRERTEAERLPGFRPSADLRVANSNSRIHDDTPIRHGEHGIEVELGDRVQVLSEAGQPVHEIGQR